MSLKIAFFGTPKIAALVLEKLLDSKFKPQLVVTGPDIEQGRGRKIQTTPVKAIAQKHKIKTVEPEKLADKSFLKEFKEFAPDVAILVAFGKIIPDEVLTIPKFGFVNIHPSLLPKYRGPSPITSAILNGDATTGATLIILDSELDHGPIIAQENLLIDDTDTHDSLAEKLASLGSKMVIATLPDYLNEDISPKPQDHNLATYTEKLTKTSGKIDIANPPDHQTLNRMTRAYFPWPAVWTLLRTSVSDGQAELRVKLLPENKIQPEGKNPLTIREFTNGYPKYKDLVEKLVKH